jgi:16S rRNA processing protein RimM
MSYPEWNLTIGEIVAPFSRFGEVKVRIETDTPERFLELEQVCIRPPAGKAVLLDVENVRLHKGQALLKLQNVSSIDQAEQLRGSYVQVRAEDAVPLSADEFFIHDLIGCEVVTETGKPLGSITQVMSGIANDVYVVGKGKDEILLPAVRQVIQRVDIQAKRIIVTLLPGLLPGEAEQA